MNFIRFTTFLFAIGFSLGSSAQYMRAYLGTDIPLQYKIGLNYQQGKHVSADMGIGYVGIPYNGDLYRVINVPDEFQSRKEFLMETTDDGWVWTTGVNGHLGKWYGGAFIQRLEIHASATYEYIIGSDLFQEELTDNQRVLLNSFIDEELQALLSSNQMIDVNLGEMMRLTTVAWQGGVRIGRRFFFKNKRWEFRTELAFSANLTSETTADYNQELFEDIQSQYEDLKRLEALLPDQFAQFEDQIGFEIPTNVDLESILSFEQKADEVDELFQEYVYIPTLNFHLTYLLWVPKKLREVPVGFD